LTVHHSDNYYSDSWNEYVVVQMTSYFLCGKQDIGRFKNYQFLFCLRRVRQFLKLASTRRSAGRRAPRLSHPAPASLRHCLVGACSVCCRGEIQVGEQAGGRGRQAGERASTVFSCLARGRATRASVRHAHDCGKAPPRTAGGSLPHPSKTQPA
jgi:hypothetical protein